MPSGRDESAKIAFWLGVTGWFALIIGAVLSNALSRYFPSERSAGLGWPPILVVSSRPGVATIGLLLFASFIVTRAASGAGLTLLWLGRTGVGSIVTLVASAISLGSGEASGSGRRCCYSLGGGPRLVEIQPICRDWGG